MTRGDLITVAMQGDFGKPRPALVIQSDLFAGHRSLTVLPLTSDLRDTPALRLRLSPNLENGLRAESDVMIDKLHTVAIEKIGIPFGQLNKETLAKIDRLLTVFLGIA
jgi:mRNA interferase MazF